MDIDMWLESLVATVVYQVFLYRATVIDATPITPWLGVGGMMKSLACMLILVLAYTILWALGLRLLASQPGFAPPVERLKSLALALVPLLIAVGITSVACKLMVVFVRPSKGCADRIQRAMLMVQAVGVATIVIASFSM